MARLGVVGGDVVVVDGMIRTACGVVGWVEHIGEEPARNTITSEMVARSLESNGIVVVLRLPMERCDGVHDDEEVGRGLWDALALGRRTGHVHG